MKKNLHFILLMPAILALMIMEACSSRNDQPVVGLLMDQFNVERWAQDTSVFIRTVNQLGGRVICRVANGDADKQLEQAKELIDKGVQVLVVVPADTKKASQIVDEAIKSGVKVISYDRLIQNAAVDYYISFDNVKVGELQADYIRQSLGKGNVALIGGPPTDLNSFYLKFGQMGELQPFIERGDIRIVYDTMVESWSYEEGYRAALECLSEEKVDAIIAGNDLLANGAIKALQEKGLAGKVLLAGQDADTEARENIVKGLQTLSIYKPIEDLATSAARMACNLARGLQVENANTTMNNGAGLIPSQLLNPALVNRGNIGLEVVVAKPPN